MVPSLSLVAFLLAGLSYAAPAPPADASIVAAPENIVSSNVTGIASGQVLNDLAPTVDVNKTTGPRKFIYCKTEKSAYTSLQNSCFFPSHLAHANRQSNQRPPNLKPMLERRKADISLILDLEQSTRTTSGVQYSAVMLSRVPTRSTATSG